MINQTSKSIENISQIKRHMFIDSNRYIHVFIEFHKQKHKRGYVYTVHFKMVIQPLICILILQIYIHVKASSSIERQKIIHFFKISLFFTFGFALYFAVLYILCMTCPRSTNQPLSYIEERGSRYTCTSSTVTLISTWMTV